MQIQKSEKKTFLHFDEIEKPKTPWYKIISHLGKIMETPWKKIIYARQISGIQNGLRSLCTLKHGVCFTFPLEFRKLFWESRLDTIIVFRPPILRDAQNVVLRFRQMIPLFPRGLSESKIDSIMDLDSPFCLFSIPVLKSVLRKSSGVQTRHCH